MKARFLLFALLVVFYWGVPTVAQEGSFYDSLPSAQREAIGQAALYYESRDFAKARDALKTVEHDPKTHPYVIMFAGDMHDRLKEYEAALQDYDLALRILGKNAYEVRWNIFLMRAKDLVELHRFEEAVPALQSALEYPGYKEGDTTAYELLAKAYKEQKQYSQARWAVMASLSVDPSNIQMWQELESVPPASPKTSASISAQSTDVLSNELVSYGFYGTWPVNEIQQRGKAYVAAAGTLVSQNKTASADNFLDCVMRAYLTAHAESAPSNNDESMIKRAMVVDELYDLSTLPLDLRTHVYYEMIASNISLQQFRQALLSVESLSQIPSARKDVPDIVTKISRLLFAYVSFDMKSGLPRRPESDEFVGQNVGETLDQQAERELKTQETGKSGPQNPKYGSVNSREDWANLTSFEFLFADKLKQIVQEQMRQEHFEVAVKLILVKLCLGGRPDFQKDQVIGIPISNIDKQLSSSAKVPDETKEAYVLAKNAASFLVELCSSHKEACE